jgi:hypothetical protein
LDEFLEPLCFTTLNEIEKEALISLSATTAPSNYHTKAIQPSHSHVISPKDIVELERGGGGTTLMGLNPPFSHPYSTEVRMLSEELKTASFPMFGSLHADHEAAIQQPRLVPPLHRPWETVARVNNVQHYPMATSGVSTVSFNTPIPVNQTTFFYPHHPTNYDPAPVYKRYPSVRKRDIMGITNDK